jgi:undecaprenyl phosphate-alpha-L-ara4FN deformylase
VMENLITGWKAQGYRLAATRTLYEALDLATLPYHEVTQASVAGRSGTLMVQGPAYLEGKSA